MFLPSDRGMFSLWTDRLLDQTVGSVFGPRHGSVSVRAESTGLAATTSVTERDSVTLKTIVELIRCAIPREMRSHFRWTTTLPFGLRYRMAYDAFSVSAHEVSASETIPGIGAEVS